MINCIEQTWHNNDTTCYLFVFKGEDSNYHFDRDFESMEELSESMSDDEEEPQVIVDQSPYRFMNGNDGKG